MTRLRRLDSKAIFPNKLAIGTMSEIVDQDGAPRGELGDHIRECVSAAVLSSSDSATSSHEVQFNEEPLFLRGAQGVNIQAAVICSRTIHGIRQMSFPDFPVKAVQGFAQLSP